MKSKPYLLLLVFLAFWHYAVANSISEPNPLGHAVREQNFHEHGPRATVQLQKRSRKVLCSLEIFKHFADNLRKRGDDFPEGNFTILPRDMTLPGDGPGEMEAYMMDETQLDSSTLIWWRDTHGNDVNNAVFRPFDNQAFSYRMVGLAGCTGLVIASRKGMYIAHYWENIGFDMDRDDQGKGRYANQESAFKHSVLKGLEKGIHRKGASVPEQDSLRANADRIDDEHIQALLMIPATGPAAAGIGVADPYRQYWDRIKAKVGEILPRLDPVTNANRWHEYRYAPVQDEDIRDGIHPLQTTSRGRMLFKFDPNHHGKKKTLLITETTQQQSMSWEWD